MSSSAESKRRFDEKQDAIWQQIFADNKGTIKIKKEELVLSTASVSAWPSPTSCAPRACSSPVWSTARPAACLRTVDPVMAASMIKPLLQDWYLKRWKYRRREVTPDSYAYWAVELVEAFVVADGKPSGEARVPFRLRRQKASD